MSRLILVSNRVAVPDPEGPRQAGGLAVAVNAALKRQDGIWFGWSGNISEGRAPPKPTVIQRRRRAFITMDLSATDYQEYYNGFANRVLWPILHYRADLAEFTAVDLAGYLRVNARFAEALSRFIRPDDTIWVHDYHLLALARELRALGHDNPIGFFLHIPCPPPDLVQALPQHAETLGALTHYDLVGVQTSNDAVNLGRYFAFLGGGSGRGRDLYEFDRRRVTVRAFPVGITTSVFARAARQAYRMPLVEQVRTSLDGRRLIIGVDRLDYSKGITHRIHAFGKFLEMYPAWAGRVTLLQITPKSRTEVPEYIEMHQTVSALVGEINGRHGDAAWTPIRYVNRSYSRVSLAGLYRLAQVGLVTPLRDGMNLVAKEFVAAQNPEDPGVLVLSQFAGAAEELLGAISVNPHETEAMAEALRTALDMPLEERRERNAPMLEHLMRNDIDNWAESFLAALAGTRARSGIVHALRDLFAIGV
ncbi:MAG TPA: trehalose-6-phosphate synthase [Stellaceae bacterium]|nr:trehalose-6-phosphate synthase [Stellaceae bacterium]